MKGGRLDAKRVAEARAEEMAFIKELKVYDYSDMTTAEQISGKEPIGVRWVDTDKGPRYRSRLCAMEFKRKGVAALFAGTPPLETLRILVAILAGGTGADKGALCLGLSDVKRAHFHAKASRRIFIRLPPEDPRHGEPGLCAELKQSMYGTRDAAHNWEREYAATLRSAGFVQGS